MHYAGKALVEKKGTITPEQQFQTISEITQTAKDMEMLSSQILNWIIYQNPNERMQKEEFDLHQLTAMVFGVLQFPAKLKNTQLQNNVPDNFVVYQFMEPLRVLIYNLVLNSINFTKGGSISVQCNIAENRLIIQVTDNGLGMTTEQIANLMSDRKIIAGANVDNKKGTGLGYMIIKDLLKMMGGALTIKSSKTNGTAVSVSLALK
jgi:signal transduction histidine kinase